MDSHVINSSLANQFIVNKSETTVTPNINDASFDKDIRIYALYILITLGSVGGGFVIIWLWYNRRRKSRVNALILHVCLSDLLVIFGACLPQLIWEYSDRNWILGNVLCKMLKFVQSFVMMGSNYMLVVLSMDRHQAIRAPLKEPFAVSFNNQFHYRLHNREIIHWVASVCRFVCLDAKV